ncbi:hypothetical protein PSACC_01939 [Paramicrosporidium saccamoebae]|uniref:Uncharacterized protein n=1 Tax=Paramicrosporidium saccamoebae TaxID=1246581 RepID=A0A2H9TKI1_9FUNG|nr:hypothetical protein PSACC_01939 [Paramicrosporidium saccamoebae]
MLSVPKDTLSEDKENSVRHDTPHGKQNGLTTKRTFSSIQTPLGAKAGTPATHRHPILRDITNSANALRANDTSEKRIGLVRSGSKPTVESKLRIADPESVPDPQTIEELLALPDDLLPDIERVPALQERDEFEGLPLIKDISHVEVTGCSPTWDAECDEILQSAAKSRKLLHDHITHALRDLVIRPSDFDWAFDAMDPSRDPSPCRFDGADLLANLSSCRFDQVDLLDSQGDEADLLDDLASGRSDDQLSQAYC